MLAAPSASGAAVDETTPAHRLRRSADFGGSGACAGCHEFRFPGVSGDDGDEGFMQTTAREHRRSSTAEKACAGCHMPERDGHRSHAFSQVRDPSWLRGRLQATAERSGEDQVRVRLVQTAPGHGFPTGDLFRRLEVGGEVRDASGKVVGRAARYLERHLLILPGRSQRQLVGDDRVFDDPVTVDLTLPPPPAGGRVSWWVSLQRVATAGTGEDPAAAKIDSQVRIHEGALP